MIRGLLLASAFSVTASGAVAQNLRVRSGEHGDYTRLVVQIPADTSWTLKQATNGASLSVGLKDVVFETDGVFDRLSANRLNGLSQAKAGDALVLSFGCDCVATAFLHHETMVVIDIAAGEIASPPQADTTAPLWSLTQTPEQVPPVELPSDALALPLLELSSRDLETLLMSRILHGIDRDVVDLTLSEPGPRQSTQPGPLRVPQTLTQNIQVSTILDEFQGFGGFSDPNIQNKPVCITDAELGFSSWSTAEPFEKQLTTLRNGLFQEFDRVDTDRAVALAKLYTFFGFGAEAIQVLELPPGQSSERARISAIAHAMDGDASSAENPFDGQQRCGGDAGLWALLIGQSLNADAELNTIEQSFTRLPAHLRRHLGPELAEKLVRAGKLEASRRVLRAVGRVEKQNSPAATLAQARIAEAEGNDARTEQLLSKVTDTAEANKEAALALARLIEKRWSDRGAVSAREIDLVAAYAVELRRSDYGPMMARAHALALALDRQFEGAFDLIPSSAPDRDWRRTQDQAAQLLTERADDLTFLYYMLTLSPETRQQLETGTAVSLSERLAALGFAEQALALANRPTDQIQRKTRARLRAQAALLKGRPRQALLELQDDASEPAQRLKARALIDAKDYPQAAAALAELGETDSAGRYFWLSGKLEAVSAEGSGKYGELARISQSLSQPPQRVAEKPLADAKALLENSAEARELIAEMLEKARGGNSQ